MQPINQIIKEISFPIWICWGFVIFTIIMAIISNTRTQGTGVASWLSILPLQGVSIFLVTVGMIFYFANDSVKRRKEDAQGRATWQGQLAAIQSSPLTETKEEKKVVLDKRLQSIDGIIGYLDQSIKMEHEPKNLAPIVLSLAKEVKNLRDGK